MAFKSCVNLLLLLSICLHFISGSRSAVTSREKCECVQTTGSVQWRKVTDFTIIQKSPLCNEVQIILQLSSKVCLNPESKPGKRLQTCWKRIKFNPQRKKNCLVVNKKNNKPKSPKKP